MHNRSICQPKGRDQEDLELIGINQWVLAGPPLSKLCNGPLIIVPRTSRIVNSRPTLLLEAKSIIYDDCVDILKSIITSDDRKITKSRDMLITPELSQGYT